MNSPSGKLIVIDGTDGSGKKTQTQLLLDRLQKAGYPTISISFPQYGKKSAGLVEEYLNGKYGKADALDPYIASLFYALDRFDLSHDIKKSLDEGKIIVTDRYVDANAGHQGGKIKDPEDRKRYIAWLYNLEYRILGIPKPDVVFILHVPAEIGQQLVLTKQQRLYLEEGKKTDAHEADLDHLKAAEKTYLWLAKQYPLDHKIVECVRSGEMLSREEIHGIIWKELTTFLGAVEPKIIMENELVLEKL